MGPTPTPQVHVGVHRVHGNERLSHCVVFLPAKGPGRVPTAPQGPTVCQETGSSPVHWDTIVWGAVLRASCPVPLEHTTLSLAAVKWSNASFVQQVEASSHGGFISVLNVCFSLSKDVFCVSCAARILL